MNNTITIINDSFEKFEANVIMIFEVKEFAKKYIVYQFKDELEDNLSTIHTSVLKEETDQGVVLKEIENDEEWDIIKAIMKDIVNIDKKGDK